MRLQNKNLSPPEITINILKNLTSQGTALDFIKVIALFAKNLRIFCFQKKV